MERAISIIEQLWEGQLEAVRAIEKLWEGQLEAIKTMENYGKDN